MPRRSALAALVLFLAGCGAPTAPQARSIQPAVRTAAVSDDADDPAVWFNAADPSRSLLLGTNKAQAPSGALVVFALDGRIRQTITGLDRPNNVDVEYGLSTPAGPIDIAVVTERLRSRLRVFRILPTGLTDITRDTRVFANRSGDAAAPMGVALYRAPAGGPVYAIVAPKAGPSSNYLAQYRLDFTNGLVSTALVREFGRFSGRGEIEAVAVDDALGYVYYADEGDGIHKYHADPLHPNAQVELAHFGRSGFQGDREGIAIFPRPDGSGYLFCADQIPGASRYLVFPRHGAPANPHDHSQLLATIDGGADSTDGLEISAHPLGPLFPHGLMAAMNSRGKNFFLYRWQDIAAALRP
jgi:3-phytase